MRAINATPVWILVVIQSVSLYVSTGLVKDAFSEIEPVYAAWYRVGFLALALLAWRRPWRKSVRSRFPKISTDKKAWLNIVILGLAITVMNTVFYIAVDNMDMGIAVSIEFLGPLTVAVITGKDWHERVGIVIAATGVVLLAGISFASPQSGNFLVGFIAILCSACMWGVYIVAGRKISFTGHSIDYLTVAVTIGWVVQSVFLAVPAVRAVVWPRVGATWSLSAEGALKLVLLLLCASVLGSFLPYVLDQLIMPRLTSGAFSVMQSINPAAAVVVGLAFGEIPTILELVGIVMVIVAVLVTFSGDRYPA
ncbi:MAG: EamA family transporter [Bifidobacteriaceae bacterium]|nr:EamA family transporter [Bifidobacteriaceae bacterium]